jgi:hypothetical protein
MSSSVRPAQTLVHLPSNVRRRPDDSAVRYAIGEERRVVLLHWGFVLLLPASPSEALPKPDGHRSRMVPFKKAAVEKGLSSPQRWDSSAAPLTITPSSAADTDPSRASARRPRPTFASIAAVPGPVPIAGRAATSKAANRHSSLPTIPDSRCRPGGMARNTAAQRLRGRYRGTPIVSPNQSRVGATGDGGGVEARMRTGGVNGSEFAARSPDGAKRNPGSAKNVLVNQSAPHLRSTGQKISASVA